MRKRTIVKEPSRFFCVECGNEGIPIIRTAGQQREAGHLKKLFCLYCNKETNHAEVRPYGGYELEDFREEFECGRFVNGQKIPIVDLMGCSKIDCDYNRNGKCWNSNYSYKCPYRNKREEAMVND